jgi:hypothetical protein
MDVLRRMRDLFVTEVRTSLLSGIFQENPDALEVYGELEAKEVTVTVVDTRNNKTFDRRVPFQEFAQAEDRATGRVDERTSEAARESDVPQGDLKAPNAQSVLEDQLRMPKLTLTKRVSADEFRNKKPVSDLMDSVSSKVKGLASRFVTEYLAAKAEQER